ncbi:MAG: 3-dehydroquinate synthase [Candidatus Woesearchaeota archaeon]
MEELKINTRNKDYSIFIGNSILSKIEGCTKNKRVVIITDDNVKKLYGDKILEIIKSAYLISIPPGETSKSMKTKEEIEGMLLEKKYGRDTIIIALGGGVIGDLSGFIASTYNRGIPIIQIPTTLLAMVDSSIGGKTGIDTKYGKNLIGTIYQPDAVFADMEFLKTLPEEEFLNGLAEIIKIAAISDKELFTFIEKNTKNILEKEKEVLLHIIKRSIELKKNVVEKDTEESGLRQILNFGHTIGHALEADSGYEGKHGYFISQGIAIESKIAVLSGSLKNEEEKRITSLLDAFSLPTKIKKDIELDKIYRFMEADKKTRNQKPRFIILDGIGKIKTDNADFSFEIDEDIIKKAIEISK